MKKRLFAIMLALAMLLVAVPALAEEGDGGKDQTVESIKKVCTKCNVEVDKVNEEGLCEKCVSNLKQDNTQQKMITSFKTLNEDNTEGGANGDSTGSSGDNTDDNTGGNPDNNAGNTDNNGGNTGGATGGEQKPCEHEWTYQDAQSNDSTNYCYKHKKTCSKCPAEEWESHVWDRSKQEMVEESTCTKQGKDKLPCQLCTHVTYVSRELKPHTKDKGTVIKSATCTEKGTIQYTCTVCQAKLPEEEIPALGHDYEYLWGTWDCKTKTITACRKCKRAGCTVMENHTAISVSEKDRDTWYSCGKKYTTVYYKVVAKYSDSKAEEYTGKAECTYSTSDYCRPDWYYDPCYYNNPCGHWGCGNVCTRYSDCVPCRDYRTTFRVGGYNCLATPKTGDVSVIGMALISLAGAGAAIMGKKRK